VVCVWVWSSEITKTFDACCEQVGRRGKDEKRNICLTQPMCVQAYSDVKAVYGFFKFHLPHVLYARTHTLAHRSSPTNTLASQLPNLLTAEHDSATLLTNVIVSLIFVCHWSQCLHKNPVRTLLLSLFELCMSLTVISSISPLMSGGLCKSQPNPVAARSKAWVCGRWLAGIAGSNPTGVKNDCLLWVFVLSGRVLCVGLIARPEKFYGVWCV
jgi:hypothetical protein